MKIEIRNNDFSATRGYEVYDLNNRRFIQGKSAMFPRDFSEYEVLDLLGENNYKKFEQGKFTFELTKKQIFAATNDINYYQP